MACAFGLAFATLVPAAFAADVTNQRTLEMPERLGLVDPATGLWYLEGLSAFYYGNPGDVPFTGDWDGDGVDTPGLYRQSDGFVYLRDSNSQGIADTRFYFGDPGDVPLAGDFDGDGLDTVSLYRPSASKVYVINRLGSGDAGLGAAEQAFTFGDPGDVPFVGDFDGDGTDDVGVFRDGTQLVYLKTSLRPGPADMAFRAARPGDRIVAGDWTGMWGCDQMACAGPATVDTLACYRPAEQRFHVFQENASGAGEALPAWGEADWLPVAGRFVQHPVDAVTSAMVGTWTGTVEPRPPQEPEAERGLTLEFLADGTYLATDHGLDLPWASFLGGNPFVTERTWTIYGVEDGIAFGQLTASEGVFGTEYARIDDIAVDADTLTMVFTPGAVFRLALERVETG